MDHQKIINQYEAGKEELRQEVQAIIKERTPRKAAELTGLSAPYLCSIKTGKRQAVTYKQLLFLYECLTNDYIQALHKSTK